MTYAVMMYLDASSEERIRAIWAAMEAAGVPCELPALGARPHISLTCYEDIDPQAFEAPLCDFAEVRKPIPLSFSYLGVFPKGIVFLGHTVTGRLIEIHRAYHEAFAAFRDQAFSLYHPGSWVPHCTLAMNLEQHHLPKAIEIAAQFPLPIEGRLEGIGMVAFPPTREIVTCELEG